MTGEISIDGVFVPTLLLLGVIAMLLTMVLTRVFNALSLYRFVAYRALVDLCLFVLLLGLLAWATPSIGFHP
ncbi:DUF1656 domain-containing protein [Sphingomonas sp. TDK1]|uniref:DUF1656 domain-containing protein n=1 Tax=Sphingomonas sp. TDK1 TaxID=453247 RepID=UPI0007D9FBA7|nr:DUF1656 domain-containing protein [Sphingomonas sp. TDK1]OAN60163.1 hypothetical protein A7X12_03555 [Sphingomonas sp. TDK1]